MADVYLFPGQDATHTFYIRSGGGAVLTADSTPVCTLIRDGVDTAETVTVTQQPDGSYLASFLIPSDWVAGDIVTMRGEAHHRPAGYSDRRHGYHDCADSGWFDRPDGQP